MKLLFFVIKEKSTNYEYLSRNMLENDIYDYITKNI